MGAYCCTLCTINNEERNTNKVHFSNLRKIDNDSGSYDGEYSYWSTSSDQQDTDD